MPDNRGMSPNANDDLLMELLDRIATRDEAALKTLYDEVSAKLYGVAMRVLGKITDCP